MMPALQARILAPPQATAGIAFSYTLQLQCYSGQVEELQLMVLETPGFVVSGERAHQACGGCLGRGHTRHRGDVWGEGAHIGSCLSCVREKPPTYMRMG